MRPIASRARCFTNAGRALRSAHFVWKRGWKDCWVGDGNSGTVQIAGSNFQTPSCFQHESFTPDCPVLCACRSTRADRQRRIPIRANENRVLRSQGQ
eukprot:IDg23781t1